MLDVGQQQFLMLLLVLKPKRNARSDVGIKLSAAQQGLHLRVDGCAIGQHFRKCRSRQQSALRARVTRPDALVVAVENEREVGVV